MDRLNRKDTLKTVEKGVRSTLVLAVASYALAACGGGNNPSARVEALTTNTPPIAAITATPTATETRPAVSETDPTEVADPTATPEASPDSTAEVASSAVLTSELFRSLTPK